MKWNIESKVGPVSNITVSPEEFVKRQREVFSQTPYYRKKQIVVRVIPSLANTHIPICCDSIKALTGELFNPWLYVLFFHTRCLVLNGHA